MPCVLLGGSEQGGEEAIRLQHTLVDALTLAGLAGRPEPGFTPHLTLLYDDKALAPQPVEPVAWRVDELLLVRSLLGRGRHEVLARLPLIGPPV